MSFLNQVWEVIGLLDLDDVLRTFELHKLWIWILSLQRTLFILKIFLGFIFAMSRRNMLFTSMGCILPSSLKTVNDAPYKLPYKFFQTPSRNFLEALWCKEWLVNLEVSLFNTLNSWRWILGNMTTFYLFCQQNHGRLQPVHLEGKYQKSKRKVEINSPPLQ